MYAGDFSIEEVKTPGGKSCFLMNLPYFLASYLPKYISHFLKEKYTDMS